jgi:dihydropyrimidine dehydrogenase (NAD+) subunit PreA
LALEKQKPSLQIDFADILFKNPFILASGPPTRDADMLRRAFAAGWAGAVIKTIPSEKLMQRGLIREPRPLLTTTRVAKRKIGMGNISITGEWRIPEWAQALDALKQEFPECRVIGSIGAEVVPSDWKNMAAEIQAAGFDGIELDLSCSHATLGIKTPLIVGEDPELARQVISWVKETVDIPVIPKLPATVHNWHEILEACHQAGASGVASINTLSALMGVDIEKMEPFLNLGGFSSYCGYSGPGIKPIALRVISQIHKTSILPVSGIGGISTWEDSVEFILLGARTVQVCTAVMWSGYKIVEKMITGLTRYLERHNQTSLSPLIGRANEKIKDSIFKLEPDPNLVAQILDTCSNCGLCITACWDGGHQAINKVKDQTIVDEYKCVGCALCLQVCPTNSIIMYSKRKS